jgi:hypothetical protein
MIKQRKAVGKLFTSKQNFIILSTSDEITIGTEDKVMRDKDTKEYYYPQPGLLKIQGSYVYKEFTQPQDILIYVKESDNEES